MSRQNFLTREKEKTHQPISKPDLIQQNHLIEESKPITAPEVIFDILENNYLAKIIKAELTPVLDIQRNEENHDDCLLQCLGIAKYVQRGIVPTGPIATGSVADDKVLNVSTLLIPSPDTDLEIKIRNGGQFAELINGKRPIQMKAASVTALEKTLREEASKELTGFVHGLIHLGINYNVEMAHAIYFFATKQEVLYIDNQRSKLVSEDKYPFFTSIKENPVYDFTYFNKNLFIIKIDNWFFRWGKKVEFQALIQNIEKIYPQPLSLFDDNSFFDFKFNPIETIGSELSDEREDFQGDNCYLPVYSDDIENPLLKFPDDNSTVDDNLQPSQLLNKNEISLPENNNSIFHSNFPEKFNLDRLFENIYGNIALSSDPVSLIDSLSPHDLPTYENIEKLSHNRDEQKINTTQVPESGNNKQQELNDKNVSLKIYKNTVVDFSGSKNNTRKKRKSILPDFSPPPDTNSSKILSLDLIK